MIDHLFKGTILGRPTGAVGKDTELAIKKESLKLFAHFGYNAVSMRMIGNAVGVNPAALYNYFETKQQLLVTLMIEHMDALLEAWKAEVVDSETAERALDRFARFHIRYHITRPDEVFISYMELRALEDGGFKKVEVLRRIYENELKTILNRGVEQGIFSVAEPHVSAMALLAMLTGVNAWYRSGGRLSQAKIEDAYATMVLMSVGYAV